MERILIIGCSGAGKTTLAARMSRELNLPHTSMDRLYWQPGWVEPDRAQFEAQLTAACREPRWVIDGNYLRTLPARLAYADGVIWLDVPRVACLARALWRMLRCYGRVRPDMPAGCPEHFDASFLRWIWNFKHSHDAPMEAALADWLGRAPQRGWTHSADGARRVWRGRQYAVRSMQ